MFAIREMRQRSGLTQSQVADALGMSAKGYYKWEHEERDISLRDAIALADLFACTLDELAGRVPPSAPAIRADEAEVVEVWRSTDERGRAAIMAVARSQRGAGAVPERSAVAG